MKVHNFCLNEPTVQPLTKQTYCPVLPYCLSRSCHTSTSIKGTTKTPQHSNCDCHKFDAPAHIISALPIAKHPISSAYGGHLRDVWCKDYSVCVLSCCYYYIQSDLLFQWVQIYKKVEKPFRKNQFLGGEMSHVKRLLSLKPYFQKFSNVLPHRKVTKSNEINCDFTIFVYIQGIVTTSNL